MTFGFDPLIFAAVVAGVLLVVVLLAVICRKCRGSTAESELEEEDAERLDG